MGVWLLHFQAELENVESITFPPEYIWQVDVQHSTGNEIRENVYFSLADEVDIPNSRGKANFIVKFEGSKQVAVINIKNVPKVTRPYTQDDANTQVPIVGFECRGLNPLRWHPTEGCIVKSTGGKVFTDVDLSDDWCDYDEERKQPVGVYKVESNFQFSK